MISLKYPVGIILLSLLLVQTVRLNTAQLATKDVEAALEKERSLSATVLAEAITKARDTELELSNKEVLTRKETNEAISTLSNERSALLKRVRIAEDRAKSLSTVSQAGSTTCNGSVTQGSDSRELLESIGEADVEEANRADTIRVNLLACYRQYDEARQALHH